MENLWLAYLQGGKILGAVPCPHPRSLPLGGESGGAGKKKDRAPGPAPPSSPATALGSLKSQALPSGRIKPLYRVPTKNLVKKIDTRLKLRHEREHLTHHHHWEKQDLLRISALDQARRWINTKGGNGGMRFAFPPYALRAEFKRWLHLYNYRISLFSLPALI